MEHPVERIEWGGVDPGGAPLDYRGFMAAKKKKKPLDGRRIICENRKARHDYHILDTMEVGLVLSGSEVKSLRAGNASLIDSYVRIERGEMWLVGAHIALYEQANRYNHESRATRKLLAKRSEIDSWHRKIREKGLTSVPLELYFKGSWVKAKVGLVKGKAEYDKRDSLREKQDKREMARAMKDRSR